jgi:hypothetical protein
MILDTLQSLQFASSRAETVLGPAAEWGICSLSAIFLGYLP